MARHHRFSKRSRESRKAMSGGSSDQFGHFDTDKAVPERWLPLDSDETAELQLPITEECDLPPDPVS